MSKAILGRKLAMTQIFDENVLIPITIVEAGPCIIVQRKVKKKNGYIIKTGHKAKWIHKTIVAKSKGQFLVHWECDVSGKLCCEWAAEKHIINDYEWS